MPAIHRRIQHEVGVLGGIDLSTPTEFEVDTVLFGRLRGFGFGKVVTMLFVENGGGSAEFEDGAGHPQAGTAEPEDGDMPAGEFHRPPPQRVGPTPKKRESEPRVQTS